MIRKNKKTDPPAAHVAALTCRFDHFPWQSFKISSDPGSWLSGEQLGINAHFAGAKNGTTTQEGPRRSRTAPFFLSGFPITLSWPIFGEECG